MAYAMLAEAYEAQRVARNYAKAAKRSLKAVQALQQACPGPKKIFWLIFFLRDVYRKHFCFSRVPRRLGRHFPVFKLSWVCAGTVVFFPARKWLVMPTQRQLPPSSTRS